ncbi:MAG: hypothetical protein IKZ96_01775 [Bacilli bacterium]|nr:hypothetical protein [Bacilli bacterium]
MGKEIKKELKEARKDLFQISTKSAIAKTKKIALKMIFFIAPATAVAAVGGYFLNIGKEATRRYYYEKKVLDNNGNEISSELTPDVHSNSVKLYNSCLESDEGYIKTYNTYYNDKIDETIFLNANSDSLEAMLGEPSDMGYEVDNTYLDLDDVYAYYTIYNKTDKEYEDPSQEYSYYSAYFLIGGAMLMAGLATTVDADARGLFENVGKTDITKNDIESAKVLVKTLKKKRRV